MNKDLCELFLILMILSPIIVPISLMVGVVKALIFGIGSVTIIFILFTPINVIQNK